VTSVRLEEGPAHDVLTIFNRGGNAGTLTVCKEDGHVLKARILRPELRTRYSDYVMFKEVSGNALGTMAGWDLLEVLPSAHPSTHSESVSMPGHTDQHGNWQNESTVHSDRVVLVNEPRYLFGRTGDSVVMELMAKTEAAEQGYAEMTAHASKCEEASRSAIRLRDEAMGKVEANQKVAEEAVEENRALRKVAITRVNEIRRMRCEAELVCRAIGEERWRELTDTASSE
jgi:hypothetical protein